MNPKISIIIITRNKLGYLRGVLASLEDMEFPRDDFEVLVVDDGSADATVEFLGTFQPSFSFRFHSQVNAGRPAARNACVAMARGELLVILDDDCLLQPPSLNQLWNAYLEHPQHMLLSNVRHVAVNHVAGVLESILRVGCVPWRELPDLAPFDEEYALAGLIREMLAYGIEHFAVPWLAAPATSVAIAAERFRRIGGFDERFKRYGMEDFDLAYRHAEDGGGFSWVKGSTLHHLDHGHQRAVLFRESTESTRLFYEKFKTRTEIAQFIKFLCGGVSFRDFNNRIAALKSMPPIEQFNIRFSPHGMVRYRDRQRGAGELDLPPPLAYSQAQEFRLRFLLDRIRRDMDPEVQTIAELRTIDALAGRSVLVIAPHMDDEVIGCGGLIHRFSLAGSTVTALFLTDGASRNLAPADYVQMCRDRRRESEKAADILGIERCIYLDVPERNLAAASLDPKPFARVLDEVRPDVILVPSTLEYHPDHRTAFEWLRRAFPSDMFDGEVLCYEVWGTCRPDSVVPLDEEIWERKLRALSMYQTQLRHLDYRRLMNYLGETRGRCARVATTRAEAYRRVKLPELSVQ